MANSYNELFGLGSHSEDANLEGWWRFDDDAASTTVADSSSNARNATLVGGDNTADIDGGARGWNSATLQLDGTNDYVTVADNAGFRVNASAPVTGCFWYNPGAALPGATNTSIFGKSAPTTFDGWYTQLRSTNKWSIITNGNASNVISESTGTPSTSTWYFVRLQAQIGGTCTIWVDGTSVATHSDTNASVSDTAPVRWGTVEWQTATVKDAGIYGESAIFSRALTTDEAAHVQAGPEPIYTSGVSFSADGTYSVGTWDSQSNGTATYEVVAANAAGSVIDSASTSSGDLDISAENGNTVYLLVRATNTGGYDIGDKATRTSAYGSSNDGYYELASVTASDGAGGGTVQTLALMGAGA